jgi:4-oxalocrotonate tautomerase
MPIVVIKMVKGRSLEQKRELVTGITDTLVKTIHCKRENVHVLIEEMDRLNWAVGGSLPADS